MCGACCSLTPEGKKLLMQYGSSLISKIKFRDNFIMIGQKGLAQGSAVEQVQSLSFACYVCLCESLTVLCKILFIKYLKYKYKYLL